ncbi:hypothetical protein KM043_014017 [Ampulex compressa]|nr:hypothetical protein KM043_014017 [Ampulex compressa]
MPQKDDALYRTLTVTKNVDKIIMYGLHSIGLPFLVFLNIMPAQELMDHSIDVFHKAYHGCWYMGPVSSQKLLLIVMQGSRNPCSIRTMNSSKVSYEMFTTVIQDLSYAIIVLLLHGTLLHALRAKPLSLSARSAT